MFFISVPLTPAIYGPFGSREYEQAFWVSSAAQVLTVIPILLFSRAVIAIKKFGTRLTMVLALFVVLNITRALANGALLSLWGIDSSRYSSRIFSNVSFGVPIMITIAWLADRHYENRQRVQAIKDNCQAASLQSTSLLEALSESFSFWNRELHLEITESRNALVLIADQEFQNQERVALIGQIDEQLVAAEEAARLFWTNGSGWAPTSENFARKYTLREVIAGAMTYRPVSPGMTAFGLVAVLAAWYSFVFSRREGLVVASIMGLVSLVSLTAYRRWLLPIVVKRSPITRWIIFESFALILTSGEVVILKRIVGQETHKLLDPRLQVYIVMFFLNVIAMYGGILYGSILYVHRLEMLATERQQIVVTLERELEMQSSLSKLLFTSDIGRTPTAGTIRLQVAMGLKDNAQIDLALHESLAIWTDAVAKLSRRALISE